MSAVFYDRKAAIRNTVIYEIALVLANRRFGHS